MSDYIVRATAADGQIRAFAANTKDVVETARKDHNTSCGNRGSGTSADRRCDDGNHDERGQRCPDIADQV